MHSFNISPGTSPLWREPFRRSPPVVVTTFSSTSTTSTTSTSTSLPPSSTPLSTTEAVEAVVAGDVSPILPVGDDEYLEGYSPLFGASDDEEAEGSLSGGEDLLGDSRDEDSFVDGEDVRGTGRRTPPATSPIHEEDAPPLSPPIRSPSRVLLQDYSVEDWGLSSWGNFTFPMPGRLPQSGNVTTLSAREHTPRLGITYAQLVIALLRGVPSAVSTHPTGMDRQFASALEGLEEFRARPPARA